MDGDTDSETFTFTINPDLVPSAPTISDQTGAVNTAVDITLAVGTGGDSPLSYAIADLPAGLSFNTSTRKITGTPTTDQVKTVTYTVTDADGDTDSETFTFTINPDLVPSAPTVSDQTGAVNTAVDITLAVGTGGDSPLAYSIADLPTGLSFNTSTRKITGTPTRPETKTVTYTVTDADGDTDSETFTFTISGDFRISSWNGTRYLSPIVLARLRATISGADITVDPVTALEGDLVVASDLTVDGVERHNGGVTIRLRRNGSANFNKYFNNSGSPKYRTAKLFIVLNDVGKTHIPFTVSNNGGGFSNWSLDDGSQNSLINAIATGDEFLLAIAEPDLIPVAPTVDAQTGVQNTALVITLAVGTGGNSPLAYSIANLPDGLSFDGSTRRITGTPTTDQVKTVTYTVTDADGDTDSETFTFTINPDLVPSAPTVSDQTGAVNTAVDITLAVGTGGDSPLAYSIADLPTGLSFNTSTRKITGTPTTDQVKTVTYTVTDADGDTDSETFTFTINPDLVPSAPTVSDQTGAVNTSVNILLPVGTGGDGTLAYSIANLPAGLVFNANTRRITGTPTTDQVKTVTYTVTDADGDTDSETFTFTINPDLVPSAPTVSDQTGAVNTAVDITLAVGTGGDSPLAYSIANLPAGLVFNTSTRRITGTPTTDQVKTVTYTVTDADGDTDSETFTFTINPDLVPSAPTVSDQTGAVNTAVDITLAVGTGGDSPLSYAIADLPAGLSFNTGTRRITGTPTTDQVKTVTYTVTDADGDTDSSTFTFTINPDLMPSAPSLSDQTGKVSTAVDLTLAVGTGGDGTLTYAIANLPSGLSFNADTREITGTPTTAEIKTVTYTVTDADGDTDSSTFTFTIVADFRISIWNGTRYLSPIVLARLTATISGADITVDPVTPLEGELVVASDLTIDGVERHNGGVTIRLRKTGSGGFSTYFDNEGSPQYPTAKLFIVLNDENFTHIPCTIGSTGGSFNNWSLDDGSQNSLINAIATGDEFLLAIAEPDLIPVAPALSDQTGIQNTAITPLILPVGTGGNGDLVYSIANLPSGLAFNATTRKITGTPTTAEVKTVTYTVTDEDGSTDSSTFTFTIAADLTPSAPTVSDQTGAVNTAGQSYPPCWYGWGLARSLMRLRTSQRVSPSIRVRER